MKRPKPISSLLKKGFPAAIAPRAGMFDGFGSTFNITGDYYDTLPGFGRLTLAGMMNSNLNTIWMRVFNYLDHAMTLFEQSSGQELCDCNDTNNPNSYQNNTMAATTDNTMQVNGAEMTQQTSEELIRQTIDDNTLSSQQKTDKILAMLGQDGSAMPSCDLIGRYLSLAPDAGERILAMARKEQEHSIEVDDQMLLQNKQNIKLAAGSNRRSQIFAFILVILLIAAGLMCVLTDHGTVAGVIFSTTIISIATVFVTGKYQQIKNSTSGNGPANQ